MTSTGLALSMVLEANYRVRVGCVLKWCVITLPDYVIVVSQVKFLLVFPCVINNSHTGDKVDNFLGRCVIQVVAALMSPVSVNPFESQVAIRSSSVSHVRNSVSLLLARIFLSFTKNISFRLVCVPLVPLNLHQSSKSIDIRHLSVMCITVLYYWTKGLYLSVKIATYAVLFIVRIYFYFSPGLVVLL